MLMNGGCQFVIPGRALRASPESITPVFAFSIHTLAQGVWIPGLRQVAHPGMTNLHPDQFAQHAGDLMRTVGFAQE
ncbi:MAG: hypothetical protein QOH32_3056, partial [Bradyrhizobium sp.]|nr:hypothetical protein [Bradyrhizobium sp.]